MPHSRYHTKLHTSCPAAPVIPTTSIYARRSLCGGFFVPPRRPPPPAAPRRAPRPCCPRFLAAAPRNHRRPGSRTPQPPPSRQPHSATTALLAAVPQQVATLTRTGVPPNPSSSGQPAQFGLVGHVSLPQTALSALSPRRPLAETAAPLAPPPQTQKTWRPLVR